MPPTRSRSVTYSTYFTRSRKDNSPGSHDTRFDRMGRSMSPARRGREQRSRSTAGNLGSTVRSRRGTSHADGEERSPKRRHTPKDVNTCTSAGSTDAYPLSVAPVPQLSKDRRSYITRSSKLPGQLAKEPSEMKSDCDTSLSSPPSNAGDIDSRLRRPTTDRLETTSPGVQGAQDAGQGSNQIKLFTAEELFEADDLVSLWSVHSDRATVGSESDAGAYELPSSPGDFEAYHTDHLVREDNSNPHRWLGVNHTPSSSSAQRDEAAVDASLVSAPWEDVAMPMAIPEPGQSKKSYSLTRSDSVTYPYAGDIGQEPNEQNLVDARSALVESHDPPPIEDRLPARKPSEATETGSIIWKPTLDVPAQDADSDTRDDATGGRLVLSIATLPTPIPSSQTAPAQSRPKRAAHPTTRQGSETPNDEWSTSNASIVIPSDSASPSIDNDTEHHTPNANELTNKTPKTYSEGTGKYQLPSKAFRESKVDLTPLTVDDPGSVPRSTIENLDRVSQGMSYFDLLATVASYARPLSVTTPSAENDGTGEIDGKHDTAGSRSIAIASRQTDDLRRKHTKDMYAMYNPTRMMSIAARIAKGCDQMDVEALRAGEERSNESVDGVVEIGEHGGAESEGEDKNERRGYTIPTSATRSTLSPTSIQGHEQGVQHMDAHGRPAKKARVRVHFASLDEIAPISPRRGDKVGD